jgi:hypothetical protein
MEIGMLSCEAENIQWAEMGEYHVISSVVIQHVPKTWRLALYVGLYSPQLAQPLEVSRFGRAFSLATLQYW